MRTAPALVAAALLLAATGCTSTRSSGDRSAASLARGSDARAVEIAEEVLAALGGADAWDETRVLAWTFFGRRSHVWDKRTGDYRLDEGPKTVLMNLDSGLGRVFEGGVEVTEPTTRANELARARSIWINDSYWLVMPFKLFDPGVTLFDAGERALEDGEPADVLRVEFEGVGDTPRNAYEVLVPRKTRLVAGWSFYQDRGESEPRLTTPWSGWSRYGGILLSGERGPERRISDIAVFTEPPPKLREP